MWQRLRDSARSLKQQALTVWYAARDPRLPWPVRLLALAVAAYAFSPIDLIPDFIPVLGLLDDVVLIPLGIALVIRLAPQEIYAGARQKAQETMDHPVSRVAAVSVLLLWLLALVWIAAMSRRWLQLS